MCENCANFQIMGENFIYELSSYQSTILPFLNYFGKIVSQYMFRYLNKYHFMNINMDSDQVIEQNSLLCNFLAEFTVD